MDDHLCYETILKKCSLFNTKICNMIKENNEYLYVEKDSDGITLNYDFCIKSRLREVGILEIIRLSEKKLYEKSIIEQRIYTYIAQIQDSDKLYPKEINLNCALKIFDKVINHFKLEGIIKN